MATPKKEVTLHHAMVKVMQEVKNIEKGLTVGSGSYSYKGVSDKDVKQAIGQAMAKNGLTCVPIKIVPTTDINRWEETNKFGVKQKMSVFVEVISTFRITHADSKESIEIQGFGQGQDTSDKAAGKATTYALKNALLYSFLVPTGDIDDTDKTHSNDAQVPPPEKPEMTPEIYANALPHLLARKTTIVGIEGKYKITATQKKSFQDELSKQQAEFDTKLAKDASELPSKMIREGAAKMTAKSETVITEEETKTEAPKEEVVPEEKPKKKAATKKKAPKIPEKVEEAVVVEGGALTGLEKVLEKVSEFTSSDELLGAKNIIELEIRLEKLTEEEINTVKQATNEKYTELKTANL